MFDPFALDGGQEHLIFWADPRSGLKAVLVLDDTTLGPAALKRGVPLETVLAERAALNPAKRLGDPAEFGAACAFLCSVHAGYVNGQNWLLDGGAYPGTF